MKLLYIALIGIASIFFLYFISIGDWIFVLLMLAFIIIFSLQSHIEPTELQQILSSFLPQTPEPAPHTPSNETATQEPETSSTSHQQTPPKNTIAWIAGTALFLIIGSIFILPGLFSATPGTTSDHIPTERGERIAYYEQAIIDDPSTVENYNQLSHLYLQANDLDKAIALYETLKNDRPNDIPVYHHLADLYYRSDRVNDMKATLDQTLTIAPDHPDVYTKYGSLLLSTDNPEDAIDKLNQAIDLDPNFGEAYYLLAVAHRQNRSDSQIIDDTIAACLEHADPTSPWYQKCEQFI